MTEMKLSVYLNRNYHYHDIKDVDPNSPGEIAYTFLKDFKEKVFQSPETVLRVIKTEALAVLAHYKRLEKEVDDIVLKVENLLKDGPHLGEVALEKVKLYQEERDVIRDFLYSIADAFGYFIEFLITHYSRAHIQFPFLLMFKDFLPRRHYLKTLLESGNEKIWSLNEELFLKKTVQEKLNYWKQSYFERFSSLQRFVNSDGTVTAFQKSEYSKGNLSEIVFNEFKCEKVVTPALIPLEVYRVHFEKHNEDSALTSWFLHFNANLWAEQYYIAKFYQKENSPILSELIERELRELKVKEEEATEKLLKKEIDTNVGPSNSRNYSLELKRIQSNYYHSHVLESPHMMGGESVVDIYARHVFFKEYLQGLQEQQEQNNNRIIQLSHLLTEEIRTKYINLIKDDQPLKAICFLENKVSEIDNGRKVQKKLTLLRSELKGLNRKMQTGTINNEDIRVGRNKIKESLLSLGGS